MTGLAFDSTGRHMATVGAEGQLKVWDMRMLRPLHSYLCHRPATTLDISQRGLLAVGFGRRIQVRGYSCLSRLSFLRLCCLTHPAWHL